MMNNSKHLRLKNEENFKSNKIQRKCTVSPYKKECVFILF